MLQLSVHAGGLYAQAAGPPPTRSAGGQDAGQPNAEIYLMGRNQSPDIYIYIYLCFLWQKIKLN